MSLTAVRSGLRDVLTGDELVPFRLDPSGVLDDPGTGGYRVTVDGLGLVTLAISSTDLQGEDRSSWITQLQEGQQLTVRDDAGALAVVGVSAAPIEHPTWAALPVVVELTSGGAFIAGRQLTIAAAGADALPAVVHDYVPEEPAPPCVLLQPAESYVQEDPEATYAGELLVTFDVIILVQLDDEHDNLSASVQLDQLLDAVLDRLRDSGDWWLLSVGQPQAYLTTDWTHHGVRVTTQTRVTL